MGRMTAIPVMLVSVLGTPGSISARTWTPHAVSSEMGHSERTFYVSPSGSDRNPGTATHPFRSLLHARDVVRTLDRQMNGDITVHLKDGTYRLSQPLQLDQRDSGSNGYVVRWTGPRDDGAVISGAERISGWKLSDPAKGIWAASVPTTLRTRQIYVDGMRATLAAGQSPVSLSPIWFGYVASSPMMAHWRNPAQMDFVYPSQLNYPTEPICPVSSITGKKIVMAQPCWDNSNYRKRNIVGWDGGMLTYPAYIENAYELLDQPGEFYLDLHTHIVYYIPRKGQDMKSADVEAPSLQMLVEGRGSPSNPIHDITFSNLQFAYATWLQPNTHQGFSEQQAGYMITGKRGYATEGLCKLVRHGTCPYGAWTKEPGNVQFAYDRDLSFLNDRFVHLGAAALNLDNGSQQAAVTGSVFTDVSGNGIEIGNVDMPNATGSSQTSHISIMDNHLYGIPTEYLGGLPILVGYAAYTTISHNQIDHSPNAAISIGWGGWLDKLRQPPVPNFSRNNIVSFNRIFDFMQELKDGGGLYTQGITGHSLATGLQVTGNVIHGQLDWGGALKADNGTTYITYSRNVLYNNTYDWTGIHWDYRFHPGTKHPKSYDPEVLSGNWWQQGDINASGGGIQKSGNTIITGPRQVPVSVLANAGLQARFASTLSWRPRGQSVPNAPQQLSSLYAVHGRAFVTWHPSFAGVKYPVTSYTLRVCSAGKSSSQGICQKAAVPSVTMPANTLDTLGYAVVSGLTDGKSYVVTVTANSAGGTSIPSFPSSRITPRDYTPSLPGKPTNLAVETGERAITLTWYRPRNDPGVRLMVTRAHRSQPKGAGRTTKHNLLVLRYIVTSSTGQHYLVSGHQRLIDTNTGSRVLEVIGGLNANRSYRFSIAAVNPSGTGPAIHTQWIQPQP